MDLPPLMDRYYLRESGIWNTLKHGRTVWVWLLVVLAIDAVGLASQPAANADLWIRAWGLDRQGLGQWELWRIVSYAPLHGGWLHRTLNLVMFCLLGSKIEWVCGSWMLTLTVFAGIILGGLAHVWLSASLLIGFSGACVALLLLWTTLSPDSRFVPFSVSGKNLGIGMLIASAILAVMDPSAGLPGINRLGAWLESNGLSGTFAVGHACHFGGGLAGWLIARWYLRQRVSLAVLRKQRTRREGESG